MKKYSSFSNDSYLYRVRPATAGTVPTYVQDRFRTSCYMGIVDRQQLRRISPVLDVESSWNDAKMLSPKRRLLIFRPSWVVASVAWVVSVVTVSVIDDADALGLGSIETQTSRSLRKNTQIDIIEQGSGDEEEEEFDEEESKEESDEITSDPPHGDITDGNGNVNPITDADVNQLSQLLQKNLRLPDDSESDSESSSFVPKDGDLSLDRRSYRGIITIPNNILERRRRRKSSVEDVIIVSVSEDDSSNVSDNTSEDNDEANDRILSSQAQKAQRLFKHGSGNSLEQSTMGVADQGGRRLRGVVAEEARVRESPLESSRSAAQDIAQESSDLLLLGDDQSNVHKTSVPNDESDDSDDDSEPDFSTTTRPAELMRKLVTVTPALVKHCMKEGEKNMKALILGILTRNLAEIARNNRGDHLEPLRVRSMTSTMTEVVQELELRRRFAVLRNVAVGDGTGSQLAENLVSSLNSLTDADRRRLVDRVFERQAEGRLVTFLARNWRYSLFELALTVFIGYVIVYPYLLYLVRDLGGFVVDMLVSNT